jgi:acetyl esterase/lipase
MIAATGSHPGLVEDLSLGNADQSSAVQGLISWYAPVDMFQLDLCDALPPETNIRWLEPGSFDDAIATGLPTMQAIAIGCIPRFNPDVARAASPIEYVDSTFPPALFQHGSADPIIPYTQSVAMWKRVNDTCGDGRATLELFDGATHGDPRIKAADNVDRCLDFARQIVSGG